MAVGTVVKLVGDSGVPCVEVVVSVVGRSYATGRS